MTGVQTCALPIYSLPDIRFEGLFGRDYAVVVVQDEMLDPDAEVMLHPFDQIGRFVFQDGADDNIVFHFEWDCLYTLNITIKSLVSGKKS